MHFRNIEGGFLNFRETFIDNGSVDMLKAMRVYKEVGYDGMMMPDHVPQIEGVDSMTGLRVRVRLHQGADRRGRRGTVTPFSAIRDFTILRIRAAGSGRSG